MSKLAPPPPSWRVLSEGFAAGVSRVACYVAAHLEKRVPSQFAGVSRRRLDAALRSFNFDFPRRGATARFLVVSTRRDFSEKFCISGFRAPPFFENQFFVVAATPQHPPRRQSKPPTRRILTAVAYSQKPKWTFFRRPLVNHGGKTKSQNPETGESTHQVGYRCSAHAASNIPPGLLDSIFTLASPARLPHNMLAHSSCQGPLSQIPSLGRAPTLVHS